MLANAVCGYGELFLADIEQKLIEAKRNERFFNALNQLICTNETDEQNVTSALVKLHNDYSIDIVHEFNNLSSQACNFFGLKNLFEYALPQINAGTIPVIKCVVHLFKESNQDLSASFIIKPFIDFLSKDIEKIKEGIEFLKQNPDFSPHILHHILAAGYSLNPEYSFRETFDLTAHSNHEIKNSAIFTFYILNLPPKHNHLEQIYQRLKELALQEDNDQILGSVVRVTIKLLAKELLRENLSTPILTTALTKGTDFSLHAAALELCSNNSLPSDTVNFLLIHLRKISPTNKNTIEYIDRVIAGMIRNQQFIGIELLEYLLTTHNKEISWEEFKGSLYAIIKNVDLVNKFATRWFLKGDYTLCYGTVEILNSIDAEQLELKVDTQELMSSSPVVICYLAHKAIACWFFKPITAASFILSLFPLISDPETENRLTELIFDPLFLNFPPSLKEFLKKRLAISSGSTQIALKNILERGSDYFDNLESIGNIPELRPSLEQEEAFSRKHQNMMEKIYKAAEEKSILHKLCSKQTILYGNKILNVFKDHTGKVQKQESSLSHYEHKIELPRLSIIRNFEIEYVLRHLISEGLIKNEANY